MIKWTKIFVWTGAIGTGAYTLVNAVRETPEHFCNRLQLKTPEKLNDSRAERRKGREVLMRVIHDDDEIKKPIWRVRVANPK
ncbi:hypothetical protein K7432_000705 [Basidiobolus ranarum]|uniref:Uncharacterized protein n=1 Tax=Basidiobolus ranarum TaxID=34480 RepID=A0ABR2X4I7_9FUNG